MKINYLIFNLIIISSPFMLSFFYKEIVYPFDKTSLISIIIASLVFIIHDILVTNKWWEFNKKYILGIKILKLPIEEILFFFSVSFSCLTIWINLKNKSIFFNFKYVYFFYLTIFLYFFYLTIKNKKPYVFFVLSLYLALLIFDLLFQTNLILNFNFLIFTLIVFFLTLIFNYYLTKKPIVIYNQKIITKIKILTIPIEDFIYGINFLYLTILIYEFLNMKFF